MRKPSAVNPVFIKDQKTRRNTLEVSDPHNQNSVPDLRNRLTIVEQIVGIRSES